MTSKELDLLETVDLSLVRQILKAPNGTPKELFYLELGIMPFRDIIIGRRINFLHTILNEEKNSLIYKFFQAQWKYKTKKDWTTLIQNDLEYLELHLMSLEEIKNMRKHKFRNIVKQKLEEKTFQKLEKIKRGHSKVEHLEHNRIKMQKYLQPNSQNYTKEVAQLIFEIRGKMTSVKTNFKGKYNEFECRACKVEQEDQKHVYECKKLNQEVIETEYEKIFNGTVREKVRLAQRFKTNIEILEKLEIGT